MAVAILVAAGSGERLGAGRPKAFVEVAGRPMLEWSVDALRAAGLSQVVVALPDGEEAPAGTIPAPGGATRSHSVRSALAAAPQSDVVVVHDAARPLVDPSLFSAAIAALDTADAAVAAARVTDTIKQAGDDGRVIATLDRSNLWAVQTPQAFRRAALEKALAAPDSVIAGATDDASLIEAAGGKVVIVPSHVGNMKITTGHDLLLAQLTLERRRAC